MNWRARVVTVRPIWRKTQRKVYYNFCGNFQDLLLLLLPSLAVSSSVGFALPFKLPLPKYDFAFNLRQSDGPLHVIFTRTVLLYFPLIILFRVGSMHPWSDFSSGWDPWILDLTSLWGAIRQSLNKFLWTNFPRESFSISNQFLVLFSPPQVFEQSLFLFFFRLPPLPPAPPVPSLSPKTIDRLTAPLEALLPRPCHCDCKYTKASAIIFPKKRSRVL